MMLQLILFLLVVSFSLHTPWELAQTKALSTCADEPWCIHLGNCSIGIVSDLLYTVGFYYLIGWWLADYLWLRTAGIWHYSLVLLISFIGACLTELVARRLDWWHFNRIVPHFPKNLGDVALTPVLQLPLLVTLTYLAIQFILL